MVRMFEQHFGDELKRKNHVCVVSFLSEGCRVILLFEDSMLPAFLNAKNAKKTQDKI